MIDMHSTHFSDDNLVPSMKRFLNYIYFDTVSRGKIPLDSTAVTIWLQNLSTLVIIPIETDGFDYKIGTSGHKAIPIEAIPPIFQYL